MLRMLIGWYRAKQHRALLREFGRQATIHEPIDIGDKAVVFNESGERSRISIGHHCHIDGTLLCKASGSIEIGNYSWIGDDVRIECLKRVHIGSYVGIGDGTFIVDNNGHPIAPEERVKHRMRVAPGGEGYPGLGDGCELSESSPITIQDVAWVGGNCLILKGITIGEGSIVARNAVVTKDVPPYTIVAGFPAKVVKELQRPAHDYFTP